MRFLVRYKGLYPVRLYEKEEQRLVSSCISNHIASNQEPVLAPADARDDPVTERGVSYRALRFFDTFKGFHKVHFDS